MVLNIIIGVLVVILMIVMVLLIYRKFWQCKIIKQSKLIIKNNGISELRKVKINGDDQYIYIEAQDTNKPIILFLHGGPGIPAPFGANSRGLYPCISRMQLQYTGTNAVLVSRIIKA